jgi:hypothetical protein
MPQAVRGVIWFAPRVSLAWKTESPAGRTFSQRRRLTVEWDECSAARKIEGPGGEPWMLRVGLSVDLAPCGHPRSRVASCETSRHRYVPGLNNLLSGRDHLKDHSSRSRFHGTLHRASRGRKISGLNEIGLVCEELAEAQRDGGDDAAMLVHPKAILLALSAP